MIKIRVSRKGVYEVAVFIREQGKIPRKKSQATSGVWQHNHNFQLPKRVEEQSSVTRRNST